MMELDHEKIDGWDVFISHASEDKDNFVRPLAEALQSLGVSVWYDEFTLKLGDSLSRSIDKGLARSRYGLVVLSPAFIKKPWPEHELRALVAREIAGSKVILPIWHGVEHEQVIAFSPPLADKLAIRTTEAGAIDIPIQILAVIRPDLYGNLSQKQLKTLASDDALKELFHAQRMAAVGSLAGGVAHDFNNVLSAIMMATDFLLNAHKPADPSFQDIMQIKQNANRAASLVRQLLAFSRRQTLRPQVLDLGEVINEMTMLLRRLIGEKVGIEVRHGRDLWPVKADISQFEQVIVNLAVNARDAMPEGGKLLVRTANITTGDASGRYAYRDMPAADYVLFEMADTGTGIDPDIIPQIFEPFFTTKGVGRGTGLGLSTVYGIIKQTGGFVYPESQVGKGSAFRIFLPRHVPTTEELAESIPQTAASDIAVAVAMEDASQSAVDLIGHGTILLVEDEEGLRALNARGLAWRGYTVLEAGNGVEAMEIFENHKGQIDLVLCNVIMPEMDGPTLLLALREHHPGLSFLFVSGYAEEAFEKSLPQGQQFSFLPKPFTLKQLVAAVKETMAG